MCTPLSYQVPNGLFDATGGPCPFIDGSNNSRHSLANPLGGFDVHGPAFTYGGSQDRDTTDRRRAGHEGAVMTDDQDIVIYTIKAMESGVPLQWAVLEDGEEIAFTADKDEAELIAKALNDIAKALATGHFLKRLR